MLSLRSKITQKLLLYFFINKQEERYVNELAQLLSVDPKNLDKKLKELEREGLLKSRFMGKQRYYALNPSFPLIREYEQIVKKTIGLEHRLQTLFKTISSIQEAYIFGSYAKNRMDASSDIDLLVVGGHKALDVQKAILPLQRELGREINVVDLTPQEFETRQKNKDPFLQKLFSVPMIKIV
ncbi:nucleotidyltransferase domain-containing protein [Candidatus Peregrinibacteria bacterium]|nr:nucleotidyltransferase domain-containing protein [Candidatus Peregrinibacteria bacterium]